MNDMVGLLGKGTEFDGKMVFEGTVRIDGKFKGEVFTKGVLMIGESAVVHAEVEADTIIVRGEVHGNLKATKKIEIRGDGKLYGNIITGSLIVEEGVLFEGSCQMNSKNKNDVVSLDPKNNKILEGV
ncbi:MAG: polymer-forming cytoskeletal protein [Deltaproteobacteria bacterium]|nr:polymer-forming cytoskeletal protein [Deltaproteobacteria bacterium]